MGKRKGSYDDIREEFKNTRPPLSPVLAAIEPQIDLRLRAIESLKDRTESHWKYSIAACHAEIGKIYKDTIPQDPSGYALQKAYFHFKSAAEFSQQANSLAQQINIGGISSIANYYHEIATCYAQMHLLDADSNPILANKELLRLYEIEIQALIQVNHAIKAAFQKILEGNGSDIDAETASVDPNVKTKILTSYKNMIQCLKKIADCSLSQEEKLSANFQAIQLNSQLIQFIYDHDLSAFELHNALMVVLEIQKEISPEVTQDITNNIRLLLNKMAMDVSNPNCNTHLITAIRQNPQVFAHVLELFGLVQTPSINNNNNDYQPPSPYPS